jgi:hypothetical protein
LTFFSVKYRLFLFLLGGGIDAERHLSKQLLCPLASGSGIDLLGIADPIPALLLADLVLNEICSLDRAIASGMGAQAEAGQRVIPKEDLLAVRRDELGG